ncbi:COG1042 Acyl-CoA synthetase (NDP forming) [Burkholderiales bacterium]
MRPLQPLLEPKSVAIIGASSDFNKLNGRPIRNLLDKGYAGAIYPVNPKYDQVGPLPCYPNIQAIPGPIDLAVIILPAPSVEGCLRELAAVGARAAVIFSAGFGETGPEGKALEESLSKAARETGIRLCGPNCLGLVNAFDGMLATFSQYADGENLPGPVGFVTQSGAFGTAIAALCRQRHLGLGFFVNTGNEADIDFVEAMSALMEDPRIRVCTGYLEGLRDGEGWMRLGARARALRKPVVVMKVGRTEAGSRAVASHTGALAGEDAVFDDVTRQAGILRARNEEHMLDLAQVLALCPPALGRGVAIATQSGGAGVQAADRAIELGLEVPVLSADTQARIAQSLPGFGVATNPIDVTGQFVAQPAILRDSLRLMLEDPQVHMGMVWIELMHKNVDLLAGVFEEIHRSTKKPFVVAWLGAPEAAVKRLAELGIPLLRSGEAAIEALAGLAMVSEWQRAEDAPAASVSLASIPPTERGLVESLEAIEWLRGLGIPLTPAVLARSQEQAQEAQRQFASPVAIKIESPDVLHKTEAGGVRLGLNTPEDVAQAYSQILQSVTAHAPTARVRGVLVQPMAEAGVECVVGLSQDPVFGPVVMVGLGGVWIELLKDVTFARCPVSPAEAEAMIHRLRGVRLLQGFRGSPPADIQALADLVSRVSAIGAALGDQLGELDLNPVFVHPKGVTAVDVLLTLRRATI